MPEPAARARLTTTLHLGTPLQINAVLLGDWPRGDTLDVDTEGYTDTDEGDRLAVLDTATTLQLLHMVSEAHTGQRTSPPVPEPTGRSGTDDEDLTRVRDAVAADLDLPEMDKPHPDVSEPDVPVPEAREPGALSGSETDQTQTPPAVSRADSGGPGAVPSAVPVAVRVLGRVALVTVGPPKQDLRRRALELLVYLAVHHRGVNLPDIKEAFWPDASNRRAGERLQTEVGDLRARVRDAYWAANPHLDPGEDKRPRIDPVVNTGGRYHLNPDLLDVDWWTVQDALAAATTDTAHRLEHLRRAVDAYGGPLADGTSYDWLPDVAEHMRRQGIIAYTQLAALLVDTDPGEAARLLDQATALDPINEELARAAMRTHARVNDADAVRAQLYRIRAALDAIDLEPDEETTTLAAELLRQITGPAPKPRPPQDPPPL